MSKRKGRKSGIESKASHEDTADDSEVASQISISRTSSRMSQISVTSLQGGGEVSIQDQVGAIIEDLEDKKAASRVSATQKLLKLLSNNYLADQVLENDVTQIVDLSRKLIVNEGLESCSYCKVLSAVWITFRGQDVDRYLTASRCLSYAIKNGSTSMQSASILSLSLITSLEKVDSQTSEDLLNSLLNIISKTDVADEVLVSALFGYGLLYGNCSSRALQGELNEVIDRHIELLDHSFSEIRVAAGENLAMIVEDLRVREIDPSGYIDSMHELLEKLKDNSNESAKHISKRDKSSQKSQSREFLATVRDDMPPSVDLKFKKDTVTVESWAKVKLLNAFKDCIGEGLHIHFYLNPIFQELFNWSGGTASERDNLRLFDTTVGKQRVKNLKEQRKQKASRSSEHIE